MKEYEAAFQNQPVDVSEEFTKQRNHFFVGSVVRGFDPDTASGEILWRGLALKQRVSYHQLTLQFEDYKVWEDTPPEEYEDEQALPFSLSFVTSKTVRLRLSARDRGIHDEPSLMVFSSPLPTDDPSWEMNEAESRTTYEGPFGSVSVDEDPVRFVFRDASGRLLTSTHNLADAKGVVNSMPIPLSFVRNSSNLHRNFAASFILSPDEKLFGGGESFTRLNKRGQKLVLYTYDAYSAQTPYMYKPVPFFVSSRGYGMFVHTSAPLTLDLGHSYDEANVIYLGDDVLDLFFFFGSPKEILSEYTAITGRAPVPPLWSFGLWMGRESYYSEEEVRRVAKKLREERIPSDVIHIDTGWTEVPHRCDFEFSHSRFEDPQKMLSDLKGDGFRVSLWQLPYINPKNELHEEASERGHVVLSAYGKPPVDDAVIDLSDAEAVSWYQEKLAKLLRMGVGTFTADFGEAAPLTGIYHEKASSFLEHNLYPLRYNKAVADITREITGNGAIYARSAWAGSQRYPIHWGGDAEITDGAMASTLRGGPLFGPVRVLLLEPFYRRILAKEPRQPLPQVASLRRTLFSQPLPRRAAHRTVGVRRRVHRSLPAYRRTQVQADALHLCAGSPRLARGSPDGAHLVLRVPRGPDLLAHRGPVSLRDRRTRRSDHGRGARPRGLPAPRIVDRLPRRKGLRGCPLAQHAGWAVACGYTRPGRECHPTRGLGPKHGWYRLALTGA
jgi:alpha-D-xyloside xylohydrolase